MGAARSTTWSVLSRTLSQLEGAGYRVTFHRHQWTECWVRSDDESWTAQGDDEDDALRRVLQQMLPSRLAQQLYEAATGPEAPTATVAAPVPTSQPSHPPLVRAHTAVAPDPHQALHELAVLQDRVQECRGDLALCAAEHQRLAMMAWICEARAQAERFPEHLPIRDEVTALSRTLTELGKAFWPGSVTALQLHILPSDLPRHVLGGSARTWHDAAYRAEQALWGLEATVESRGRDAYGYVLDSAPAPDSASADAILAEVASELAARSGELERGAEPEPGRTPPTSDEFLRWARRLRAVRTAVTDPEAWARCVGRLRWWASRRHVDLGSGERALDPAVAPAHPPSEDELRPGTGELPVAPEAVVDHWRTRRVLCIVDRRDPGRQDRLQALVPGLRWSWRLVDGFGQQPSADEVKGHDLVLSALGLQASAADRALADAAKAASVPYTRIVYGSSQTVVQRLQLRSPPLAAARTG
jgi:hypothetical protein